MGGNRNGRALTRSRIARVVAMAVAVPTALVGVALAEPGVVAADEAFDTPPPPTAPRIDQPRDVASVVPARLLETRTGPGLETVDGRFDGVGALAGGTTLELVVAGRGGVPEDAKAVMLNVTAVEPIGAGFVTVFPCGSPRPLASNVNHSFGDIVANAVLAKIGDGGRVCVFTQTTTDMVIDVNGFVGAASGTTPVVPARLLETRSGPEDRTADGQFQGIGRRAAGSTLELTVTGRGGVPGGASAVMLNVTAVAPIAPGFLTVFPCGTDRPFTSNVNYATGDVVPNAVLAKVGSGGRVCIFTLAPTDLVVDVNGFVGGGEGTTSIEPRRLLETRTGPLDRTSDGLFQRVGRVGAGETIELPVAGRGGVPEVGVGAAMLNVTAVAPLGSGFLTVYPCGAERPTASNVNYVAGDVVPNAVLARLGNGGKVCIYSLVATDVVVDVNGWYGLPPNQPNSNVTVLDEGEFSFTSLGGGASALIETTDPLVPDPEVAIIETDTSELDVGDVVVVEKPNGDPYYGRVEQREEGSVRTEQVALAEVVPAMDVALEADTATGAVVKNEGGDAVSDVDIEEPTTSPDENRKKQACGATAGASVELSAFANPGNFVFDVSFSLAEGLESARIGYAPFVQATAGVSIEGGVACQISRELFTKRLPTIKFVVAGVPVMITQQLDVKIVGEVSASATAERSFTARAEAFVGMIYEDGHWEREASMDLDVTQSSQGDVQLQLSLGVPSVTYEARAYGIVGLDVEVAATIRFTYRPTAQKYLSLTASVDVGAALVIELDLKLVTLRFAFEFVNYTLFGPIEMWSAEKANTNCLSSSTGGKTLSVAECRALKDIYDALAGSSWTNAGNWGQNTDPCDDWTGVVCANGRVTELNLRGKGLIGDVPADVGDLGGLRVLDLSSNQLDSLPSEIAQLDALETLNVSLTGLDSVPTAIGGLASLTYLDLGKNPLTTLPASIGDLSQLETLIVEQTGLVSVPSTIGRLSNLNLLILKFNELEGLPSGLWDLTNLDELSLQNNDVGGLSPEIGRLTKLRYLDLRGMGLVQVPSSLGNLIRLRDLRLADNRLGSLPSTMSNYPDMELFWTSGNPIAGDITAIARGLRDVSPNTVTVDIGSTACPTVSDASVRAWLAGRDPNWNAGC